VDLALPTRLGRIVRLGPNRLRDAKVSLCAAQHERPARDGDEKAKRIASPETYTEQDAARYEASDALGLIRLDTRRFHLR
jgi:hypothetical protein